MDEKDMTGQVFELVDEEGNVFLFELLDFVTLDEKVYAVITSAEDEVEEDVDDLDVIIMEVEFEDEDPIFALVEDQELCQRVLDNFVEKYEEEDLFFVENEEK